MAAATVFDPFHARDTFDTGAGKAGIYRLSKLEEAGLGNITALPYSIRVLLESLLRNCDGYAVTARRCESPRRLECRRAGSGRNPVQAGPRRAARFHGRTVRCRSRSDAFRHETPRRRPQEDQSASAGRSRHRPLGASRLLQLAPTRSNSTSIWNSPAIASATNSSAGDKRRSTTSASCRPAPASSTR